MEVHSCSAVSAAERSLASCMSTPFVMFPMSLMSSLLHRNGCLRYPDQSRLKFSEMTTEQQKAYNTATWWDFGVLAMGAYMIWVAAYYLKVSHARQAAMCHPGPCASDLCMRAAAAASQLPNTRPVMHWV